MNWFKPYLFGVPVDFLLRPDDSLTAGFLLVLDGNGWEWIIFIIHSYGMNHPLIPYQAAANCS
jgi:hypothetical protein